MKNSTETIVAILKSAIDVNGPDYLKEKPFKVYGSLVKSSSVDKTTAGAVLYFLINDMLPHAKSGLSEEELSKKIQSKCCLNKMMADRLTEIFQALYSKENIEDWEDKVNEGLEEFLGKDHEVEWSGDSEWDYGGGGLSCHYNARFVISPTEKVKGHPIVLKCLKSNPFATSKELLSLFVKNLSEQLQSDFDDYCTAEKYYEPVVEDFECDEYIEDWCKQNGFELIDYDGDGYDDGYERW